MARFFIDRPVFAWVIALFILLAGGLAITRLPVAQYPSVAPPTVVVTAVYPGASATVVDASVTSLIEQELNGARGLEYVESSSSADGVASITVAFAPGTDPELAAVDVQNRMKRVEARLPAAVKQQGIDVNQSSSSFLLVVSLSSTDGTLDPIALGDYIARNIVDEVRRVPGVGSAQIFGTERAMRVWLDPDKLAGLALTPADVIGAIQSQNVQVSAGTLGDLPNTSAQTVSESVVVTGQLTTPDAFADIVLRARPDGSVVRLGDVARVELGGQSYASEARLNGKPSSAFAVQLAPTGNALATATAVHAKMDELARYFPPGVRYDIPFDSSEFVRISIEEVVKTLLEAVALVFLVMYLFLQDLRATFIPTIVVPVALLGSFAVMYAFGFSINVLTMFGLVLAIGILVDDAIVVVENVERIMSEEGLPPREATHKAMGQITGAIVGITVVLVSVFLPMALFGGAVGAIYRQFSLAMVASMLFSALMALTLTPALCASLLRPVAAGHRAQKRGFFGWFDRRFAGLSRRYQGGVAGILGRKGRFLFLYALLAAAAAALYLRLPTSFLPNEDQGSVITSIQLPPGASANRTEQVVERVEGFFLGNPAVRDTVTVKGFSFFGSGQNAGIAFSMLKDWDARTVSSDEVAGEASGAFSAIRDAIVFAVTPPPIMELATSTGFSFRLQDRAGLGHDALLAARDQLLGLAAQDPLLQGVHPEGLEDTPQLELSIDRAKANALGVAFTDIGDTLAITLGSAYANDFPSAGRQQRVIVQADADKRMQPEDLDRLYVRNATGEMVALSVFTDAKWVVGPVQLGRYDGYPSVNISGDVAPGRSTGEGMAEMERLVRQLPLGIGYEWTGQSREEKTSGSQAPALFALSFVAVFLCLAALYESWSVPTAVLLVVPLGILGAVLATTLRGMPNDVYFKVGLIAIIGLSAKNAILIIEFAKDLHDGGTELVAATLEAVKMRFRPIVMTSLAFILGVAPLVVASGAGSGSQRAIGTAVMGGMIAATALAVFLVPVFFVVIRRMFGGRTRSEHPIP